MLRDPEFGPTRLRAFGTFAIRVSDVPVFLRQIVGTDGRFTMDEIGDQLRDMLIARFADALGESKIAALDLAANQDEIGRTLIGRVDDDFKAMGLQIASLVVENISLPPEVEAMLEQAHEYGRDRQPRRLREIPGRPGDGKSGGKSQRHGGHGRGDGRWISPSPTRWARPWAAR